jgi:hypothetical protein
MLFPDFTWLRSIQIMPQVHKRGSEGHNRSSKKFHSSHDCPSILASADNLYYLAGFLECVSEQAKLDSRHCATGIRQPLKLIEFRDQAWSRDCGQDNIQNKKVTWSTKLGSRSHCNKLTADRTEPVVFLLQLCKCPAYFCSPVPCTQPLNLPQIPIQYTEISFLGGGSGEVVATWS